MKPAYRLITTAACIALLLVTGVALSDDKDGMKRLRSWFDGTTPGIDSVLLELYVNECGGCHFSYQPELLPARSWEKIMGGLDQHFGENAELDQGDQRRIKNFLLNHSAGGVNYGLPSKFMRAQGDGQMPQRITEMRYFVHEHSELPKKLVQDNPKVRSFSNCDSCHQKAKQGVYDEYEVRIPGFGRWDD